MDVLLNIHYQKSLKKDENHGGEILDITNTEMTTLEIDGRYGIPCVMTYTIMCGTLGTTPYNTYTGIHIANWECYTLSDNLYMVTSLECSGGGNIEGTGTIGTGTGTGGNSNTGPNGGSGAGTTPSIPTSPISPFGSHEIIQKTPCESLNKILQTPSSLPAGTISIKDALTQLSDNADDGLDHEEGFNFAFNPTTGQVYAIPASTPINDNNKIVYSKNQLVFGGAHFHQFGLEPQFSHDDLYVLNTFNTQFSNPNIVNNLQAPLPMHLLVTTDGDVYAIMAEDMLEFSTLINDIYNNEDKRTKFRDKLESRYAKFFRALTNSYTGDAEDYQETLLKFINNVNPAAGNENGNLSLKLYKASKVNDVLTGEWKELKLHQTNELNFNNFTVEKINCN
ncbi:hypothetical protein [Flavobacterium sp.]|uniref:hypothetical protein n=1 Tax=Flavobacterium sp. TaxID=239 RepID=UPI0026042797|nr:hypothetical protein [Flavobacterium sp.]